MERQNPPPQAPCSVASLHQAPDIPKNHKTKSGVVREPIASEAFLNISTSGQPAQRSGPQLTSWKEDALVSGASLPQSTPLYSCDSQDGAANSSGISLPNIVHNAADDQLGQTGSKGSVLLPTQQAESSQSELAMTTKATEDMCRKQAGPIQNLCPGASLNMFRDGVGKVMMDALDSIVMLASVLEEDLRHNRSHTENAEYKQTLGNGAYKSGGCQLPRVSEHSQNNGNHVAQSTSRSIQPAQGTRKKHSMLLGRGSPIPDRRVSRLDPHSLATISSGSDSGCDSARLRRIDTKDSCVSDFDCRPHMNGRSCSSRHGSRTKSVGTELLSALPSFFSARHRSTRSSRATRDTSRSTDHDSSLAFTKQPTAKRFLLTSSGLLKILHEGDSRQDVVEHRRRAEIGTVTSPSLFAVFGEIAKRVKKRKENVEICVDQAMGLVILANVIVLALSSDMLPEHSLWLVLDIIFAVAFLAEFLFKTRLLGCQVFFCGLNKCWNIVEFALVVLAWFEVLLTVSKDSSDGDVSVSTFRIVRIVRITRIVRVARLPMFTDLVMMINGAVGGLKTLLWAVVLIAVPLFAVGLVFRETIGRDDTMKGQENFADLPTASFTLFRCVVAGDCNDKNGKPIFVTIVNAGGQVYAAIYATTMLLMTFGLFNVIVAIYVESTVAAAKYNDLHLKRQRLRDQKVFARKACEIVETVWHLLVEHQPREYKELKNLETLSVDPHAIEIVTHFPQIAISDEFFAMVRSNSEFQELLKDLDIADDDQMDLFDTLDVDGSGYIDLSELILGIKKLRGDPRRSDVIANNLMSHTILQACEEMEQTVQICRLEQERCIQKVDEIMRKQKGQERR